jgi:hypothetical protein
MYSDIESISFTLDTIAPSAPSITLSPTVATLKGLAGSASAQQGAVQLKGAAGDIFTTTLKGSKGTVTLSTRATDEWTPLALTQAQSNTLGNGPVSLSSYAADAAGNISPVAKSAFTLDLIPPVTPKVGVSQAVTNNQGVASTQIASAGAITAQGTKGDSLTTTFTNGAGISVSVTQPSDGTSKPVPLSPSQLQTLGGGIITTSTIGTDPAGNRSQAVNSQFNLATQPVSKSVARIDFYDTATDLFSGMQFNFRMMEGALNTAKDWVEIYALWDQSTSGYYATGGGKQPKWSSVGTAMLTSNPSSADPVIRPSVQRNPSVDTKTIYTTFALSKEIDTGDIANLKNFVQSASTKGTQSISSRTLILSNHGGGILSGFNFDSPEHDANPATGESMSGVQLANLLSQNPAVPKYDIVGFDECLMGSVELAYNLRNVTRYLLASEQVVNGNGFDYFRTLANTNKPLGAEELGKRFVESFRTGYGNTPQIGEANTLALTDLSKISNVTTAIRAFVDAFVPVQSTEFWNSVGNALLRGTYYEASYYQDLAAFVGRVAQLPAAPENLRTTAADLLNALGSAILDNTLQANGKTLIPAANMEPVDQASYGLSVVLPYNADSYAEMTQGAGMESFIDSSYRQVAGDFIQATGWDKLLLSLESNDCFKSMRSPLIEGADAERNRSTTTRYTDSSKLDFYLSFFDYADNSTGNPLDNDVVHPLGFLNGYTSGTAAKVKLGNLKLELEIIDPSEADLQVAIWDAASNKAVTTLKTDASKNVVVDLATQPQNIRDLVVSPSMELRVMTTDEIGVAFSSIVHLNGNRMLQPSAGLSKSSPKILATTETYVAAQILDNSTPERWFKFRTDRLPKQLAIETLSVSDATDIVLEIIENPDTPQARTVKREGTLILGQYFTADPSTDYAVHVYKKNPKDGKSVDFSLEVAPPVDPTLLNVFRPDVLSVNQDFQKQGQIAVAPATANQSKLSANLFVDEATKGATFAAIPDTAAPSIGLTQITTNRATNALSRAAVEDLNDESEPSDLLSILKRSVGASIGSGAAKRVDLSKLGASFTVTDRPSTSTTTTYKSTDPDVVTAIYEDDISVIFGNGDQIALDSGIYQLPEGSGKQSVELVAANGNSRPANTSKAQTDSLFFYPVDSAAGDLYQAGKWIRPGDSDYAATALGRALNKAWSTPIQASAGIDTSLSLDRTRIAMGMVSNGTVRDFLTLNPQNAITSAKAGSPHAFFSVASANPDGLSHVISLGNSTFAFEDTVNGGKNDFTALMVRFDSGSLD